MLTVDTSAFFLQIFGQRLRRFFRFLNRRKRRKTVPLTVSNSSNLRCVPRRRILFALHAELLAHVRRTRLCLSAARPRLPPKRKGSIVLQRRLTATPPPKLPSSFSHLSSSPLLERNFHMERSPDVPDRLKRIVDQVIRERRSRRSAKRHPDSSSSATGSRQD